MRLKHKWQAGVRQIEIPVNNMKQISFLLIFSIFLFGQTAFAEGNCPPGYYPIGGQGVLGCAPMSSGSSGSPQPTGQWDTRWGALARSKDNSVLGASDSEKKKSSAKKKALDLCVQTGGEECKVTLVYKNSCVAQAQSRTLERLNTFLHKSAALAEESALKECAHQDCRITYSACSLAEFRRY
ncbi:DUF4189 domain-containing protein [Xanthomonas campestris pv. raphani]|uniref:DUF4189 domain-containing protein n=1 Tax=Xanthomonas campestris TaxID=339 RepID=UPI001305254D|nr:DUF4189 domain-containing protein [Xanthomonas campestris]MEA9675859.1 DUF4189 domain-containing protein [Xanthomonas campestris pv. raphani]MEA9755511.1 DUF4189 domain-containing protein [Xanthomonas campestris pv. raphani]MEA9777569.1 DUF4189 domain-containing protein [Xanthomonas campestris pv. raphani]MEA9919170.1 DUF4189 domain-containing protein [Xanthomonas campestris pv. raphani]MEA9957626.1 DUF4189 domain-containing protein [Xanthomonas campestris pv. raphani]